MENNTILVIDDDRNILAIIELYLKKAGFQVYTCADGTSALAAFHETKPSLVVLDIMLPGRDGWAVLHDIRMESETPVIMLTAPGPAARLVVQKAGMTLDDIDLFEVNEAFAAVLLKFLRDTGVSWDKVNVNGGAMALGHPIGATGGMLIGTLLYELERRDLHTGLVTMCTGGGMATATIIERI